MAERMPLAAAKWRPRKRFSQNFLIDDAAIAAIVAAIRPRPADRIVEVGPGLGALTQPLLAIVDQLHAVEIDRDLAQALRQQFAPRLVLHNADALEFDFASLGTDLRVIGNLPYHISTPLLFRFVRYSPNIRDIHVMLQKEVVARMVAEHGDSNFGRLSVMLQYRFSMEKLIDLPAEAFDPVPKVASAVARLTPLRPLPHPATDEELFARVVAAAFSQRRKTLRNSLGDFLNASDYTALEISPLSRAQNLSVAQYVSIANYLSAK